MRTKMRPARVSDGDVCSDMRTVRGDLMHELTDLLRRAGLRATNSRLQILCVLNSLRNRRPDVYEIYRTLVSNGTPVSMGNIYRVLKEMSDYGLIRKAWERQVGEPRYYFQLAINDDRFCRVRMTCPACGVDTYIASAGLLAELELAAREAGITSLPSDVTILLGGQKCIMSGTRQVEGTETFEVE